MKNLNGERILILFTMLLVTGNFLFAPSNSLFLSKSETNSNFLLDSVPSSLYILQNGSGYVIVNSSNSHMIIQSSNRTFIESYALATVIAGYICSEIYFDYNLTIPANVYFKENITGRVFCNLVNNHGGPYFVSEDSLGTGYYLVRDSEGGYISNWLSKNAEKVINAVIANNNNNTIFCSGNFVLNNSITDNGRSNITIDGQGMTKISCTPNATFELFAISSAVRSWQIRNFEVNASNQDYSKGKNAIFCSAINSIISGNIVSGAAHGCIVVGGSGFWVNNNTILDSRDDGIINSNASFGMIKGNQISNCGRRNGISLVGGSYNLVIDNVISDIQLQDGIAFENLYGDIPHDYIITNNTINRTPTGIGVYQHSLYGDHALNIMINNNNISFSDTGIAFGSGRNITVQDNRLVGLPSNTYGIIGNAYVSSVYIDKNIVCMNDAISISTSGIYFFDSSNLTLRNNTICGGNRAISTYDIDNVTIDSNDIYGATTIYSRGILLRLSVGSIISSNKILSGNNSSGIGILLFNSCNRTIVRNNYIASGIAIGIYEQVPSDYNTIVDNTAEGCNPPFIISGLNDIVINNTQISPLPSASSNLTITPNPTPIPSVMPTPLSSPTPNPSLTSTSEPSATPVNPLSSPEPTIFSTTSFGLTSPSPFSSPSTSSSVIINSPTIQPTIPELSTILLVIAVSLVTLIAIFKKKT